MATPIALQLYSVREALERDFAGVVRSVANMGYLGVETASFPGTTPKAAAQLFGELGLEVTSAHLPLPLGEKQQEVLDTMGDLGCERLISAYLSPESYGTVEQIKRNCDLLNEANSVAKAHGLTLGVHNHWWEFEAVEGRTGYDIWRERLDPEIFFELDTYWIQTAGVDAAEVVRQAGSRAPLLHIKDGPATRDEAMVAVGDGRMDITAVVGAAGDNVEWLIVELDRCATDMMGAVEKSYAYLVGAKLAEGGK
ncbi:MAG: sugar phosphate isomerase/epimerase [Anaerolineaceae bacterium]|nr:MAG: sugar phosphate isomerase/epimerase [Anaerolineaceae bacterium]